MGGGDFIWDDFSSLLGGGSTKEDDGFMGIKLDLIPFAL